ncbi:MAG: MBL fold metallo-hydrolase [Atopobiaceae bacterium]|nr:MBL fold metallo-hydrolase [Atopobiaceae bacterium]
MGSNAITINKHTSIRIEGSSTVYCDPFELESSPHDADVICLTHSHFDHFSPDDISRVAQDQTVFVFPAGMESELASLGVTENRTHVICAGETCTINEKLSIHAVAAYNIDKAFHPQANGWVGYIIELDDERYYIVGDSDDLAENHGIACDVVCVPVGGTYTMDTAEAATFVSQLKTGCAIPTHYGSVVGTPEMGAAFAEKLAEIAPDIEVVLKY